MLPVYNHGSLLGESIRSVLDQTYQPLELIVVDDGSTDCTVQVLEAYAEEPGVRIVRQANCGLSAALNRGFALAQGSFLSWTSADNRYLCGAVERLMEFMLANPAVGLAYANVKLIDAEGVPLRDSAYRRAEQQHASTDILLLPLAAQSLADFEDNFVNACFLYRREVRNSIGAYRSDLAGYEDYDYWLRTSLIHRIAHIDDDKPYYEYRLHKQSLTAELETKALAEKTRSHARRFVVLRDSPHIDSTVHLAICENPCEGLVAFLKQALSSSGYSLKIGGKERTSSCEGLFGLPVALEGELAAPSKIPLDEAAGDCSFSVRRVLPSTDEPGFINSSHLACLTAWGNDLFLLHQGKGSAAPHEPLTPGILLAPPLDLSPALRRSRDSDFRAVTASNDSEAILLVFSPEEPVETCSLQHRTACDWCRTCLLRLVADTRAATFVLLCRNREQRRFADRLFLELGPGNARNLRIVDLTQPEHDFQPARTPADELRSLVYVLGSADAVLTVRGPTPSVAGLLELRCEAAYAAMAGIPVLAATPPPVENCLCIGQLLHADNCLGTGYPADLLSAEMFSIPHLLFVEPASETGRGWGFDLAQLVRRPDGIRRRPDQRSLEQWLAAQSRSALSRRFLGFLASLLFCSMQCR